MNLIELTEKYPTELDAIQHFEKVRWGKKPECAYCGSTKLSKRTKDNRFKCYDCNKTGFVTTGTNLHSTNLDLKTWMNAFMIVSNAKKGISARQLKRDLGISHPTAWKMYHRIRDIMSIENDEVKPLEGIVELDTKQVDEKTRECTKLAKKLTDEEMRRGIPELDAEIEKYKGKFKFKHGEYEKPCRSKKNKPGEGASEKKIAGVVSRDGDVVAHVVKSVGYQKLKKLINSAVKKSKYKTVLLTDMATGNKPFKDIMNQIRINHHRLYSYRGLNTNTIESFWAFIERQIVGQHHHVTLKYLEKYVAETVFKFNNRKHEDDMFETLVRNSMLPKRKMRKAA